MRTLHPTHPTPNTRHPRRSRHAGFTLIEAALTTVIVGTGVLAIVAAQQAYHAKNNWAQRTGTGMLLANEIRELTMSLPLRDPQSPSSTGVEANEYKDGKPSVALFDDLDDFAGEIDGGGKGAGLTFAKPINALRNEIPNMDGWAQTVYVRAIWADNISSTVTEYQPLTDPDLEAVRVEVVVTHQRDNEATPETIAELSWVILR